mmetsp:Transcript_2370/g.8465  ORF Transcript_2370/g.8465 Transcript_2370/m.8465 type:complete len:285 (-) Transcript_2370:880-1734(-)
MSQWLKPTREVSLSTRRSIIRMVSRQHWSSKSLTPSSHMWANRNTCKPTVSPGRCLLHLHHLPSRRRHRIHRLHRTNHRGGWHRRRRRYRQGIRRRHRRRRQVLLPHRHRHRRHRPRLHRRRHFHLSLRHRRRRRRHRRHHQRPHRRHRRRCRRLACRRRLRLLCIATFMSLYRPVQSRIKSKLLLMRLRMSNPRREIQLRYELEVEQGILPSSWSRRINPSKWALLRLGCIRLRPQNFRDCETNSLLSQACIPLGSGGWAPKTLLEGSSVRRPRRCRKRALFI